MPESSSYIRDNSRTAGLSYRSIIWLLWLGVGLCSLLYPGLGLANTLTRVDLSEGDDYARLTFTFAEPLANYVVKRNDVDHLVVNFGPIKMNPLTEILSNDIIRKVGLEKIKDQLVALIQMVPVRYEVRHFTSEDHYSLVVDIKTTKTSLETAAEVNPELVKTLEVPTLSEVAHRLRLLSGPTGSDDQPYNLQQRIYSRLETSDLLGAVEDINLFHELFPHHPFLENAGYLLAEAMYLSATDEETSKQAVQTWKEALESWSQSILAQRGQFMLATVDHDRGNINEAAAHFKILGTEALSRGDIYTSVSLLKAIDLLLSMGLFDEAWGVMEPVLNENLDSRLWLEVYVRSGMSYFYQGFYSQANEIFREVLRLDPNFYQSYPEMLYAMGESYHYLNRPDLSRMFLMHALNLMPEHTKVDVMMARIGENYRKEGRDPEAMAIYGVAQRNFPNSDGGLISQMRLADMGALHSFFSQYKVFDGLEQGTRQATVEMYKITVKNGSKSPLMQLAKFHIGTALSEEGENAEAIEWLKDLETDHPQSTLLPEALPTLSQALADEFLLRETMENWAGITDLYADNSSYVSKDDLPGVQRMVALSYEKQGNFTAARDIWHILEEQTPQRRLARVKSLITNSLQINQPNKALDYAVEMEKEFPKEKDWIDTRLTKIGHDLARPRNARATDDLKKMVSLIDTEPVRLNALADAIEIEINDQRYERAMELMDQFRHDYPDHKLSPEYLLTQVKIDDHEKRYENGWDHLSLFRERYPDDPRGTALLLDQIEQAENLGRPDDVFRFMELYRHRNPDSKESRAMLAARQDREWEMERYQDAQDSLETYRQSYPEDPELPEILIKNADRDWGKGHDQQAQELTQELMDKYPKNSSTRDFLLNLAQNFWDKKRYEEAEAMTKHLLRLYPQEATVADLLIKRAKDDWDQGRREEARKGWEEFRVNFPNEPRLSQSYIDQYRLTVADGQAEEASRLAEQLRASLPPDSPVLAELLLEEAKDYLAQNQTPLALAKWEQFRQTYPSDTRTPELLLLQARQEMKLERVPVALNHYKEFINQYPGHALTPEVYLELATAEAQSGQELEAWNRLVRYNRLFPRHSGRAQALLEQVELGKTLDRPAEAAELYEVFRRNYPEATQAQGTYLEQARLEVASGNNLKAIDTLSEGILAWPALEDDQEVQSLLADLYLETGQVEKWGTLIEKNLKRGPKDNLPDRFMKFHKLAQIHDQLGQPSDAERNLDSALDNRPPNTSPETLYSIAGTYKKLLRTEKYTSTLALVRDSGDPFWQKIAEEDLAAAGVLPAPTAAPDTADTTE